MCSVAALGDSGHGGDMNGGEELSAPMASLLEEGNELGEREINAVAHSGSKGVTRELGDALRTMNRRRRSPAPDDEHDNVGDVAGLPGLRE